MSVIKLAKSLKDKSKDEIIKDYIELYKEKEKLEKELKKYKNSNTPSSVNKHVKANTYGLKAKKNAKRGAPKGHKGSTFVWPEVNEIIDLIVAKCAQCTSTNIVPTGYIKNKKVVCLIKPKVIIKEYRQHEYRCIDCNTLTLANRKDIPEKGIYDNNLQALVNYFKFKMRMPLGHIAETLENICGIPMTRTSVLNITRRASDKLEPKYRELEENVKKEMVLHGDETSCSVNGVNHWMWIFCNQLISLFKFNKLRGGDIVEKILGKKFQGVLVSDGWKTYTSYSKKRGVILQRCWDHLRREVKYECEEKHPDLYKWCCDIYFMTKKGRKYKQKKRRKDIYEKCKAELARLIVYMDSHTNLRKLATKIRNGGNDWFTTILHPEIPIDNNEAERSLRPFVIMRKIIGCLRSEIGMRDYEIMMSLISTWKKQGKNTFYTLQSLL